jgi:hypothetical protein
MLSNYNYYPTYLVNLMKIGSLSNTGSVQLGSYSKVNNLSNSGDLDLYGKA